jgi:hypothetical protein
MFFMARQTAPTFPGSAARQRTITASDKRMAHCNLKTGIYHVSVRGPLKNRGIEKRPKLYDILTRETAKAEVFRVPGRCLKKRIFERRPDLEAVRPYAPV